MKDGNGPGARLLSLPPCSPPHPQLHPLCGSLSFLAPPLLSHSHARRQRAEELGPDEPKDQAEPEPIGEAHSVF